MKKINDYFLADIKKELKEIFLNFFNNLELLHSVEKSSDDYTYYRKKLNSIKEELKNNDGEAYNQLLIKIKEYELNSKNEKKDKKKIDEAMINIRALIASPIVVESFINECINHDAIEYIKNEMLKGNIPMEFDSANNEYKVNLINISKEILFMLKSKNNGSKRIFNIYNQILGKSKEVSDEMINTLKISANTLSKQNLAYIPEKRSFD